MYRNTPAHTYPGLYTGLLVGGVWFNGFAFLTGTSAEENKNQLPLLPLL